MGQVVINFVLGTRCVGCISYYGIIITVVVIIISYHIFLCIGGHRNAKVTVAVSAVHGGVGYWRKRPVSPRRDGNQEGYGMSRNKMFLDGGCAHEHASGDERCGGEPSQDVTRGRKETGDARCLGGEQVVIISPFVTLMLHRSPSALAMRPALC